MGLNINQWKPKTTKPDEIYFLEQSRSKSATGNRQNSAKNDPSGIKTTSNSVWGCPWQGSENQVDEKTLGPWKGDSKRQPMLLHEIQKMSLKNEYDRFWALDRGLETPKNRFARGLGNILISISEIDGDWERFR